MTRQSLQVQTALWAANSSTPALLPATANQLEIYDAVMEYVGSSTSNVGLNTKMSLNTGNFSFGTITDASTPDFADATASIIAGGTNTIFTTTTNDGCLIQSSSKFNFIGVNVTQGESGSPVYAAAYYNGTNYTALTTITIPSAFSTGVKVVYFFLPTDWVVGTTTAVGGNTSMYSIRLRATTAPGTAVQINELWLGKMLFFKTALAQYGTASFTGNGALLRDPIILSASEGLLPYFATANSGNNVRIFYKNRG
jgi:hypothetical protein